MNRACINVNRYVNVLRVLAWNAHAPRNKIMLRGPYRPRPNSSYWYDMMAEGDLHSYVCDDSSQESASDSEDFLEGKFGLPNYNV